MSDYRSLEHKIRNLMTETINRNTEQRMKVNNVGRPTDDVKNPETSKLAKQAEIKTKIIDEVTEEEQIDEVTEEEQLDELSSALYKRAMNKAVTRTQWNAMGPRGPRYKKYRDMAYKFRDKGMEQEKKEKAAAQKVKEDDSDDAIARINAVTSNIKQMTNEPKPAPKLPNVNDIPSSNPASKMFKIKEAKDDSGKKTDMDHMDAKKIRGGKTEVMINPTTDDRPENTTAEDEKSKKATTKANKEIGAKGVKEETMSGKLTLGSSQSLINSISEAMKRMKGVCPICGKMPCVCESMKQKNVDEKLVGGQHKIDANKNGKIDAEDFKLLKQKKKMNEARGVAPQAVDKHNCATHVYHEEFGEGKPVYSQHAEPDANGLIEWYNVAFGHGIEKHVMVSEMTILASEGHMDHPMKKKKKKKMEEEVEFSAEELVRIEAIAKSLK